jgi:hypothetical protein
MLRKTLIALAATAALGIGAGTADARTGGGGGGGGGAYHGGGGGGGGGAAAVHSGGPSHSFSAPSHVGPSHVGPSHVGTMGPRSGTWRGANWNGGRHHHRHDRFFFGAGFAGPYYGYGYDSCWRLAQTYYGWQRVWVCGDYPYWGY